jgi:hypothetical protein
MGDVDDGDVDRWQVFRELMLSVLAAKERRGERKWGID